MSKRSNIQLELAFGEPLRGEAPKKHVQRAEGNAAGPASESTAVIAEAVMERVVARDNLRKALKRVCSNKGAPGVDTMSVEALALYLKDHWLAIRARLLAGAYVPQPVRRVEIPKAGGGTRTLGIPTVLDRFIQQAVMQVLQAEWDGTFNASSYGFRPGRSAHQAVAAAQEHIASGYRVVVDLDIEKFFDRVNHDILMGLVAKRVSDRRVLGLIRGFLTSGAFENGLASPTAEGTPQGGPLSPLLSNLMLDELDKELERRGHRFARYADDCNIYVRSQRSGERVMASVERFLGRRLKLKINRAKSAVGPPHRRKFLGFSFTNEARPRRRVAPQSVKRFKERVRELTGRMGGKSLAQTVERLALYLTGWRGYFGFCETPGTLRNLEGWTRRRLRAIVWTQWQRGPTRFAELRKRGVDLKNATQAAGTPYGPWRSAAGSALQAALPNGSFLHLGLPSLLPKGTA